MLFADTVMDAAKPGFKIGLRRGNQWVILAGFQLGILLDLIFMRGRKETIELAA